jgi:hypothetical protein
MDDWVMLTYEAIVPRDLADQTDVVNWTMGDYLCFLDAPGDRLIYAKDVICPPEWWAHLESILPESMRYHGPMDCMRIWFFSTIGSDCFKGYLDPELRANNLMAYIGSEGTLTNAHTDLCSTIGHNVMIHADGMSIAK